MTWFFGPTDGSTGPPSFMIRISCVTFVLLQQYLEQSMNGLNRNAHTAVITAITGLAINSTIDDINPPILCNYL